MIRLKASRAVDGEGVAEGGGVREVGRETVGESREGFRLNGGVGEEES